jgi:iron complex outermembrane receptor protein
MQTQIRLCGRVLTVVCLAFLAIGQLPLLRAQQDSSATLTGTVLDPHGKVVASAAVQVKSEASSLVRKVTTGGDGRFSVEGLPVGAYTVEASAPGFSTNSHKGVQVSAGGANDISISLSVQSLIQEVTVSATADDIPSVASQDSPVKALLDERSATSVIDSHFIQNFASPLADFGELVQMVPGTYSLNSNGVGLGQDKTYFRGFPDGDYDIDYDGIPFYDTNTPTHHSWAFFPAQWIGGVDFDRSPGSASTIGPTPFGGSIHLLSKEMPSEMNIRGSVSYGSFNTKLYDGEFDSGSFGPNSRSDLLVDVHRMSSFGYQTFNFQMRNAGELKYTYRISDNTMLTGYSGVIWLDSNTPNFSGPTRAQVAANGPNFLLTDNANPTLYTNYEYNFYHVPTDFEYIGLKSDLGHGWLLDVKPYTYSYYNHQNYANAVTLSEPSCDTPVTKKGVTAIPCAVDKLNSYRKFGLTSQISNTSKWGILRAGLWYEWAGTNRFQIPSDPLNNWADQTLPNFHEEFWTNSYQMYAEYQMNVTHKLKITAGLKGALYTMNLKQFADDGKTIGNLNGAAYIYNYAPYHSILPSIDANYHLLSNWSVYGQASAGNVVPPSSVFDYNQTVSSTNKTPGVQILPAPSTSKTIQTGSVLKLQRLTLDVDYYHIWFQNGYSSVTDPVSGEQDYYLTPSSITRGIEGEANVYFGRGISAYVNATDGKATYTGPLTASGVVFQAPSGLWVSQTPSNTEALGVTYQHKAWDAGFFDKRIGPQWIDNGSYHNQVYISPFSLSNLFMGYTIRSHSRFNQTQLRLSFNNLFDQHDVTNVTPTNSVVSPTTNGVTNPFLGTTALSTTDVMNLLPGRSIMLSVIFGFSPKNR